LRSSMPSTPRMDRYLLLFFPLFFSPLFRCWPRNVFGKGKIESGATSRPRFPFYYPLFRYPWQRKPKEKDVVRRRSFFFPFSFPFFFLWAGRSWKELPFSFLFFPLFFKFGPRHDFFSGALVTRRLSPSPFFLFFSPAPKVTSAFEGHGIETERRRALPVSSPSSLPLFFFFFFFPPSSGEVFFSTRVRQKLTPAVQGRSTIGSSFSPPFPFFFFSPPSPRPMGDTRLP